MRWSLIALGTLAAAVPTVLFAQSSDSDVSRAPDGHILHRKTLEPGDAPTPDTPVFVYEPGASSGVPRDLVRDGVAIPRPSASTRARNGELIHTAAGLESPEETAPPSEASAPPGPAPAPPEPLPAPGPGAVTDPSAPFPPTPLPPPDDADAVAEPATAPDATSSPAAADTAPASPPDAASATSPSPDGGEPAEDPREGLGGEARLDRATQREGTLHYNEVFDPSVVPFKRNRSLDTVGEDFVLRVSDGRMERLEPVGNRLERGREVFWGSLLLSGQAGERIPIPSVSPEGRILSYQANPAQLVRFERDVAGNFYATPELDGRLRLVFVTDAPAHWFGRSLPPDARFEDVPRSLRPKVPKAVQREGLEVAAALGIPPGTGYTRALERLVAHFRAFEPGDPPPSVGSIYRDIALGKKGICRHRGHAFVITAQALGIPAHYVFNEAHVFVEVWVPGSSPGWLRVDLGGGADELRVHGAEGKSLHEPVADDPFEKPPAFLSTDTAGAIRTEGMPEEEAEGHAQGPGEAEAAPLEGPIVRARPAPLLEPTRTDIEASQSLVYRGDALRVSGSVTALRGGVPIESGTVQVLLAVGPEKRAVALLGTASIAAGRFSVEVAIPPRQSPGHYEIIAEFIGDGVYAPSVGE